MGQDVFTCRHCGRPIAVPASHCPWCGEPIMVICAACKQYTDDQASVCQHCGAPLVADTLQEVRAKVRLHPLVAQLAQDKERAKLTASGVVSQYLPGFFYSGARQRTVLADLFGTPPTPQGKTAALLFAAIAYLVQKEYCTLEPTGDEEAMDWDKAQQWDGQIRSLEGKLASRAGMRMTIAKVVDQVIADVMDFRFEVVKQPRLRAPGAPHKPLVRDLSKLTFTTAVIQLGLDTVLPEHQESEACRTVYKMLLDFVQADPQRARTLAAQIGEVVEWYSRYEQDPVIALTKHST